MNLSRTSGILLHPTSLPGPYGIGDLGPEAFNFADFLEYTGQGLWQVLPLGPTGYGNSPYMCFSAFAGNHILISPDMLVREGLLDSSDLDSLPPFHSGRVDYGAAKDFKKTVLLRSYQKFKENPEACPSGEYTAFCEQNAFWLEDYALFMALKKAHDGQVWTNWEQGAAQRDPESLAAWKEKLGDEIGLHKYLQYIFFRQWNLLKDYCHGKGIRIVGDIPVYVSYDSADVWGNRHLFFLDEKGSPRVVAGVPPDYFSSTGQRWGNPIYQWDLMKESGYRWWTDRFRQNLSMVDIVKIDHFRGFEAYWEIPASEPTAVKGRWVKGPGASLFRSVRDALGDIDVIAEDLGVITDEVTALREESGFPGMKVLQFAFDPDFGGREYLPHNHVPDCVVYTATHDNDTTTGWFNTKAGAHTSQTQEEIERERAFVLEYLGRDGNEIHWEFIRLAMGSVADAAIFPLQDLLGLGSGARMNLPGTSEGNWEWRFTAEMITPEIRERLKKITRLYERGPVK